ncbi:MAG: hypothetical protein CMJ65_06750 [Planctomycetaceae bacterium]|nr:hypothetical protein [Planctomycetaceae bacterium]
MNSNGDPVHCGGVVFCVHNGVQPWPQRAFVSPTKETRTHTIMRSFSLPGLCAGLLVAVMLAGCGGPDPSAECNAVSLTVTYKGKPVEGAQVAFNSTANGGRPAQGTTDAAGKAVLGTFSTDDGAMPGKYKVTVSKAGDGGDGTSDPSLVTGALAATGGSGDMTKAYSSQVKTDGSVKEAETSLPKKYATTQTSTLEFTVGAPPNDFTVELKDD